MNEETKVAVSKLEEALKKLSEGATQAKDELDKDGVIQRFEFTFELMWKALKVFLEFEGMQCKTPRDCLKTAFKTGMVRDEETFLNMLEDRNKTSHIYSKEESERIFERIRNRYASAMAQVLARLKGETGG